MRNLPAPLLTAVLCVLFAWPWTARAQFSASKPNPGTPSGKNKNRAPAAVLQPRAPVIGQPFDDREIELYIETEGRKLFAASRIPMLHFEHRTCALQFAEPAAEKLTGPAVAVRAEAATLVLGEFSRDRKKSEIAFSVAGGAFVVGSSGVCVTSLHVAKDKSSRGFCAMTRDGRVFPVREILAVEPLNDLAILQLDIPEGVSLASLPLALEPAPVGSPVFVMSHPDDRFYLLSTGFVARHTVWRTSTGEEAFMTITADFAKGSSGCPVLDERGAVVGIVNNTESIYYDDDGRKRQTDLQMVVKNATPSWAVRAMLETTASPELPTATAAPKAP